MSPETYTRRVLFKRQRGKCYYCGIAMTMKQQKQNTCTRDHIIPQSFGGNNKLTNLVGACVVCNNARGIMPASAFLIMMMTEKSRPPSMAQIYERLERDIAEIVSAFARARCLRGGVSWSNNRLPSKPFHKNGAATFSLAEIWPS